MKLLHPVDLAVKLSDCHLILDTNVFLHAVEKDEFYELLVGLHKRGCAFMTTPSVIFEFSRAAKSLEEYNWYVDYVNSLGVEVYGHVEEQMMVDKAFSVILQAACKKAGCKASYTDFLLTMLLHKFAHTPDKIFLMTSNYHDVPLSIFDRGDMVALEYDGGIQAQALYKNSPDKLTKISPAIAA